MKLRNDRQIKVSSVSAFIISILLIASIGIGVIFSQSKPAAAVNALLGETFTNSVTDPNQWQHGGDACLTAGNGSTPTNSIPACSNTAIDSGGEGALRLTTNGNDSTGYAILNTPIPSAAGFKATFDMYQYNSSTDQAADGLAFLILDGSATPSEDSIPLGGALGYGYYYTMEDGSTEAKGIDGGYAGIGFDVYGNYSLTNCGSGPNTDCRTRSPNTISVRGSRAAEYVKAASKVAAGSLNVNTTDRNLAKRTVVVTVSTNQILTVTVDYNDGNGPITEIENLDLSDINGKGAMPATIKVGFSASTGYFTDVHEIRNLSLTTLEPDLTIGIAAPKTTPPDSIFNSSVTVNNGANAGPLNDPANVEINMPNGMIALSANGDGWTCNINGQKVSCLNSSSLQSGVSYPPINLTIGVDKSSVGQASISASVTTISLELDKDNNSATALLTIVDADESTDNDSNPTIPITPAIVPPNTGFDY